MIDYSLSPNPLSDQEVLELEQLNKIMCLIVPKPYDVHTCTTPTLEKELVDRYFALRARV